MYKVLFKMIRYHFKDYMLYFYCNILCVAFFLAFLSIYQNQSFINNYQIDSSIAYNSYAPTVLMGVFMILFIPCAYGAFLKKRKEEYAVFLTLGMTQRELLVNMTVECILLNLIGGAAGLICGTGFSVLFLSILRPIVHPAVIHWEFHADTYLLTIQLCLCTTIILLSVHILQLIRSEITELFQAKLKEERRKRGTFLKFCFGGVLFFVAVLFTLLENHLGQDILWFTSMGLSLTGIAFFALNADSFLLKTMQKTWKLSISFVLQYLRSFRIVTFLAAVLFGILIYFAGTCITNDANAKRNALTYSPYDIAYVQNQNMGINLMEENDLHRILNDNGVSATKQTSMHFLRSGVCNLVSADEINRLYGTDFKVAQGNYIYLLQKDPDDGYEHPIASVNTIHIMLKNNAEMQLNFQEYDQQILFNICRGMHETTLIIHNTDYQKIQTLARNYLPQTEILITLDNWKISASAVRALSQSMQTLNGFSEEEQFDWKVASKIEQYQTAVQSSQVLEILTFFDILMFFIAANTAVSFKIKSESKDETRTIRNLYRIGITDREVQDILLKKNLCYYLLPLLFGIIFGIIQSYNTHYTYHYGWMGILFSGIVSMIFLVLQFGIVIFASRQECTTIF